MLDGDEVYGGDGVQLGEGDCEGDGVHEGEGVQDEDGVHLHPASRLALATTSCLSSKASYYLCRPTQTSLMAGGLQLLAERPGLVSTRL